MNKPEHTIIRRPEVEKMTGLGRSSIYAKMAEGEFPKPVKLGIRAVGWKKSTIISWVESRIEAAK